MLLFTTLTFNRTFSKDWQKVFLNNFSCYKYKNEPNIFNKGASVS